MKQAGAADECAAAYPIEDGAVVIHALALPGLRAPKVLEQIAAQMQARKLPMVSIFAMSLIMSTPRDWCWSRGPIESMWTV